MSSRRASVQPAGAVAAPCCRAAASLCRPPPSPLPTRSIRQHMCTSPTRIRSEHVPFGGTPSAATPAMKQPAVRLAGTLAGRHPAGSFPLQLLPELVLLVNVCTCCSHKPQNQPLPTTSPAQGRIGPTSGSPRVYICSVALKTTKGWLRLPGAHWTSRRACCWCIGCNIALGHNLERRRWRRMNRQGRHAAFHSALLSTRAESVCFLEKAGRPLARVRCAGAAGERTRCAADTLPTPSFLLRSECCWCRAAPQPARRGFWRP